MLVGMINVFIIATGLCIIDFGHYRTLSITLSAFRNSSYVDANAARSYESISRLEVDMNDLRFSILMHAALAGIASLCSLGLLRGSARDRAQAQVACDTKQLIGRVGD